VKVELALVLKSLMVEVVADEPRDERALLEPPGGAVSVESLELVRVEEHSDLLALLPHRVDPRFRCYS
jgi:hypothetical protein